MPDYGRLNNPFGGRSIGAFKGTLTPEPYTKQGPRDFNRQRVPEVQLPPTWPPTFTFKSQCDVGILHIDGPPLLHAGARAARAHYDAHPVTQIPKLDRFRVDHEIQFDDEPIADLKTSTAEFAPRKQKSVVPKPQTDSHPPHVLPLGDTVHSIVKLAGVTRSVFLVSLIYQLRLRNIVGPTGVSMCETCVSVTTLILASKYLEDVSYSNARWAAASGIDVVHLNQVELLVLKCLKYNLHVSEQEVLTLGSAYTALLDAVVGL